MLTPFDDYPIHASADPVGVPASGDPNHYDRYWFNGHQRDGDFYFGAAMGHYLSLIHISEPTRLSLVSRMPSSA